MGVVSLIVMEPGSMWPGHVRDSENVVAVGDKEDGLVRRTRETLASLRLRGHQVRVAVLACNEAIDVASITSRALVARELLAAVAAARLGRLVLSSAERTSTQVRREILSLAGALTHSLRGASVRVTFDTRRSRDESETIPQLRTTSTGAAQRILAARRSP
jgi:hypothetical protein